MAAASTTWLRPREPVVGPAGPGWRIPPACQTRPGPGVEMQRTFPNAKFVQRTLADLTSRRRITAIVRLAPHIADARAVRRSSHRKKSNGYCGGISCTVTFHDPSSGDSGPGSQVVDIEAPRQSGLTGSVIRPGMPATSFRIGNGAGLGAPRSATPRSSTEEPVPRPAPGHRTRSRTGLARRPPGGDAGDLRRSRKRFGLRAKQDRERGRSRGCGSGRSGGLASLSCGGAPLS